MGSSILGASVRETNDPAAPSLADLVTILYRPRATMRRILESGGNRWWPQLAFLAAICTSINNGNFRQFQFNHSPLPISLTSTLALATLAMIVAGLVWIAVLFVVSWIVAPIGRLLGGTGSLRDVRAALAWGLVPAIWSIVFRIPMALYVSRFRVTSERATKAAILDFLANGGCAIAVVLFMLQLLFFGWFLFVGSNTLAEAQRFSSWRGLANLALVLAVPLVIAIAAIMTLK